MADFAGITILPGSASGPERCRHAQTTDKDRLKTELKQGIRHHGGYYTTTFCVFSAALAAF
jgi:hypothetical protein